MSAKLRAEEALQEMKATNPYFDKYAAKIAALQQKSPEELLNRLESVKKTEKPETKEQPRFVNTCPSAITTFVWPN